MVTTDNTNRKVDSLEFFSTAGIMSSLGQRGNLADRLPNDIGAIVKAVQGLLIHIFWLERYGVKVPDERKAEVQLRSVEQKLDRILELDNSPLETSRVAETRLIGNCRDFSLMIASILRHQGVPARARCGFATYFQPNHFEDHWVCEYWNSKESRWVLIDGQLDDVHFARLNIDFDPFDVPRSRFIAAGRAWALCRQGLADPLAFGIFDMSGLGFIRGNLVRDMASLNKMELLPWDFWGVMEMRDEELTSDDFVALDSAAELTAEDVQEFRKVQRLYREDERFSVPSVIRSYTRGGVKTVELPESNLSLNTDLQQKNAAPRQVL